MAAKNQMDLTRGPLFRETVVFTLPLVLSGLLQLGFHAADMIVIGRYASADSLAAVGATGALCVLLVAVFCGLAVGANVVVANFYGARDHRSLSRAVHTSVLISLAGGAAVMLAGAAAVEVGAANLTDPFACKKIIDGLPAEMGKYGIERLSDIIGGGHAWEKT